MACEFTGTVRREFRARGHGAYSCDLLPATDDSPHHYQCDVRDILDAGWGLMIAHPPCTYLCSSGLHWGRRGILVDGRPRQELTDEALDFVRTLMQAPIERIAIENPRGRIGTQIDARQYGFQTAKATQYIQPHDFGHDASKSTGLWLKNLEPLQPTQYVEPRIVNGKKRWGNQTDSGQNKLGPSPERWAERSATYAGIARAMALQWGNA